MRTRLEPLSRRELERSAPDASLDELTTLLAEQLDRSGREVEALRLLTLLNPAAAARRLLSDPTDGLAARGSLGGIAGAIADACIASPDLLSRDETLELIAHYGHLLATDTAIELTATIRQSPDDPALQTAITHALTRAPTAAGLLCASAEIAIAQRKNALAHDLLTRLGRADGSTARLRFIRDARRALGKTEHPELRIAVLSSFTIDPLLPFIDLECRSLGLEPLLYLSPFNTWERETLGDDSGLQRFDPQLAFLAAAADDLIPQLAGATSITDLTTAGLAAVDRILAAAERFTAWSPATLVVHSLHSTFRDPMGPASGRVARARSELFSELNQRLADGLRALPRAHLLDVADVLARRRQGTIDNPKMRHLAGMRLGDAVLGDLASAYAQFIAPVAGRTRKCVVVDLDNTLWGGIVGEDGPHGIRLGKTSPGSEFREFQQFLLSLTQRGVLLAVISKNNANDALEVIRGHESMLLREDVFSAIRINWESKPDNMLSIAQELSLGLDSFVFVDDNEKERALMRQALPQVLTPEMPRDPALYRSTLENLAELHVLTVTAEDRSRTRQYLERRQRESLRVSAQSVDEYLRSLSISVLTEPASERTLARVHQLFQRTNQFNLTGQRYELGVLASRAADPDWRVVSTRVSDRFGDHGLVCAAVIRARPDEWVIENLVMSCRVIGYGVEDALLARLSRDAHEAGARRLIGLFIPSSKNAPAKDFYSRNAFTRSADDGSTERWARDLNAAFATPAWIEERVADGA